MIVVGAVLAGGQSRRMGGSDKFLRKIGGRRMLDHTLSRLVPQVDQVVLSANGNRQSLADYPLPIVEDHPHPGCGPLAGILASLRWTRTTFGEDAVVVSVAADTPFIPLDLATRLVRALEPGTHAAVAASLGQTHHAIAAWPARIFQSMEGWLLRSDSFAVRDYLRSGKIATVDFAAAAHDPFFNVNRRHELVQARAMAERN